MKKLIYSTLIGGLFVGLAFSASAKIWRLNNSNGGNITPAINADFTGTLQAAHDNASVQPGDTIHVEQSNTNYGSLVMSKRLVIIGPGYFMNENPKTQVVKDYGASVGRIEMMNAGSAGSVITGLTITASIYMGQSRIVVARNYVVLPAYNYIGIGSGGAANLDSVVVTSNYIKGAAYYNNIMTMGSTTGIVTNFICSNNFITNQTNNTMISLAGNISGLIRNNILNGPNALSVYNMYVVNNIQYFSNATGGNAFYNSVVEFNMGMSNSFFITPGGTNNAISNNLTNANPGFIGTGSTDGKWKLLAGAAAQGAGKNGEDMGMFGGQIPYVLSGMPTIPNLYSLTIDPIAPGAANINVTISTKSN